VALCAQGFPWPTFVEVSINLLLAKARVQTASLLIGSILKTTFRTRGSSPAARLEAWAAVHPSEGSAPSTGPGLSDLAQALAASDMEWSTAALKAGRQDSSCSVLERRVP
jgi:hypothetical protein